MAEVVHVLRTAVLAASLILLLLFVAVAALDLVLALIRAPSVGSRIRRWARHYPAFLVALLFVFGALLGHFFSQP